jgi:hypothetical protein
MLVTVIFQDDSIGVDGEFRFFNTVIPNDNNWKVIQWYGTHGRIEVYLGDSIWLDNISLVQPYIDQWNSYNPNPNPPVEEVIEVTP